MQHSLSATLLNACKLMSEDPFIKIFFFEQFLAFASFVQKCGRSQGLSRLSRFKKSVR